MSTVPELLAAIRPEGQDFPLLLHIVGATVVFGALLASSTALALARGDVRLLRLGYFSLLLVGLPGLILLRLSAEWIYTKQGWDDVPDALQPTWLGIGLFVADFGALLFLLALVLGGVGIARLRRGGGTALLNATMVIALILAVAYVVAVWAMAAKPI
jgi:hypothetical protein